MTKSKFRRLAAIITALMLVFSCLTTLQTTSRPVKASNALIDTFRINLISGASKNGSRYVWNAANASEGHQFVYRLVYAFKGNGSIAPGDIEIRIPAHIVKNRYGSYDDLCELAIPTESEAEDNKHLDLQLNGERVWLTEDDFAAKYGSIGQATAVAIDLRKKADGSDFILGKNCSVAALIYMRAPGWADDSTPMETYNEVYISDREPCFSPSPSYCCREGADAITDEASGSKEYHRTKSPSAFDMILCGWA